MDISFAVVKTFFKYVLSSIGLVKKFFIQPKLEISIQRSMMTNRTLTRSEEGDAVHKLTYEQEIRITNNSEYPAYHVMLNEIDVEVLNNTIDYNLPIAPYESKIYYITVKATYIHLHKNNGLHFDPPRHAYKELKIQYENSNSIKFFTVFKSDEPIKSETRHVFGKV